MIKPPERRSDPTPVPVSPRGGLAICALLVTALAGVGHAADPPKAAPPAPATATGSPLTILSDPAQALATMADGLDKDAGFVLATAAGMAITKGDVADVIRAMPVSVASLGFKTLSTRAMDQLLRQRLAAASAQKAGIDKDPVVVRREKAASERVLAEAWVNHEADAAVTEKALRVRYERDIVGKPGPEEVRARVILVPTEAQARDLIARIQAGEDFADLARQYSKDLNAASGGDIGYVPLDALSPEVGSVLFAMAPGQVTAYPVRALPGYYILRIEGRRQRATPTFEEARPDLANVLRREAAVAAVESLTANIRVKEPGPGEAAAAGPAAKPASH